MLKAQMLPEALKSSMKKTNLEQIEHFLHCLITQKLSNALIYANRGILA